MDSFVKKVKTTLASFVKKLNMKPYKVSRTTKFVFRKSSTNDIIVF